MNISNKLKFLIILSFIVPQATEAMDGLVNCIRKNSISTSCILGGGALVCCYYWMTNTNNTKKPLNPETIKKKKAKKEKKTAIVVLPGWPCPDTKDFYVNDYFPNNDQSFSVSIEFKDSGILKKTSSLKYDFLFEKLNKNSTKQNYFKDAKKLFTNYSNVSIFEMVKIISRRARTFKKTNFGQKPDLKVALKKIIPLWEKGLEVIIFGHSRGSRVAIGLIDAIVNPDEYADLWKKLGVVKYKTCAKDEPPKIIGIDKEKIEKFGQLIKKIFLANPLLSVKDVPLLKNEKLRSFLGEITRYDYEGKEGIEILRDIAKNKKQIPLDITLAEQDETVGNIHDKELKKLCDNIENWNVSIINKNHGDIVATVKKLYRSIGIDFDPPRKTLDLLSPKKKELYIFQTLLGLGKILNAKEKEKLSELFSDLKNKNNKIGLKNLGISLIRKFMA